VYVFAMVPPGTDFGSIEPIATFREAEGLTIIADEERARRAGLRALFRAAWITLTVHSDLDPAGRTERGMARRWSAAASRRSASSSRFLRKAPTPTPRFSRR